MALARSSLNPCQFLFELAGTTFVVRNIKVIILQGVTAKLILLAMPYPLFCKKSKVINQLSGLGVLAYYRFQGVRRFFS